MAETNQDLEHGLELIRKAFYAQSKTAATRSPKGYTPISETDKRLKREAKRLTDATANLADTYAEMAKLQKKRIVEVKDDNSSVLVEQLNEEYADALKKAETALFNSTDSFRRLEREVSSLAGRSIPEQIQYLKTYSGSIKNISQEMNKQIRSSSMLSASMIAGSHNIQKGTHEYQEMISELQLAAGSLNKGLLRSVGAWDEATNSVRSGLNKNTFAGLRLMAGEAELALSDAFSNLKDSGVGSISDLVAMERAALENLLTSTGEENQKMKAQVVGAIGKMASMGYDLGPSIVKPNGEVDHEKISSFNRGENINELVEVLKQLIETQKKNKEFIRSTDNTAFAASQPYGKTIYQIKSLNTQLAGAKNSFEKLGIVSRFFGKSLFEAGAAAAQFAKFKEAIKEGWRQMVEFNVADVPASFASVQVASVKMGMSFEETVKFMKDNKNTLAIYGKGFDGLRAQLGTTMRSFGYNMKQAADIIPGAIDTAIGAGVNFRNGDQLNAFVEDTMNSFKKVRGVIDVSAEQYMRLNAQLLSSSDIQNTLIGLSQQQAQAYSKDLIAERDRYAVMLGSTEQANELLKAQQRAARAGVVQRMREGAMTMIAAKQAGLSDEQAMAAMRIRAKGRTASAAEQTQLQSIYGQIGVEREKQIRQAQESGGTGSQQGVEAFWERVAGGMGAEEQIQASMAIATRDRSGAIATPDDLKRSADAAAGSTTVANVSNIINQVSSLLGNTFFKAVMAGVGSMVALTASALTTAASLRTLGISAGGKAGSVLGTGAGAIKGRVGALGKGALALGRTSMGGLAAAGGGTLAAAGASVIGAGAAGYGLGTLLEKKTGIGSKIGGGLYDLFNRGKEKERQLAEEKMMIEAVARGRATRAARLASTSPAGHVAIASATMGQPSTIASPSINQPGQPTTTEAVNNLSDTTKTDESGKATMAVQDMTAHDYLSTIAENMVQAVGLLQAMAAAGDSAPLNEVAARLRQQPLRQTPTANAFITGRQTAGA